MSDAPDPDKVRLAHEPDFHLGGAVVSPSTGRVRFGDREAHVEPRVMEVLIVLARAAGATVSRDHLIAACWDGRIVSDDAITRIIAKVRALGRLGDPPPFIVDTIPKVGFRLVPNPASDAGFEGAPPPAAPPAPARRRPVGVLALAALVVGLVVAVTAALLIQRFSGGDADPALIEVVALSARAEDPDAAKLASSVSDSLVRVLSTAGMEVAPQVARREDGASSSRAVFRLAGAIDRDERGVFANIQFLDRASGIVLWSVRVDATPPGQGAFADEVAQSVAGPLQCALEDRRRFSRPMPPQTFALYLGACDGVARMGNPQRMLNAAQRLVEAAPHESTAHAMLAIAQAQVANGLDHAPASEVAALRSAADASARRALALNPETPKAYLALANNVPPGGGWFERERHLVRVAEIDPAMGPGRISHVILMRETGRLNEALELTQRSVAAGDPRIAVGMSAFQLFLLAQLGRTEELDHAIAEARRVSPGMVESIAQTIDLWWRPDLAASLRALRQSDPVLGGPGGSRCPIAHLEKMLAGGGPGLPDACVNAPPDVRARYLARQGDVDGAFAELTRRRPAGRRTTMFLFYPEMASVRRDPRFMAFARQAGLVDYWTRSGRWPDFCADPTLPYDCRAAARAG